MRHGWSWLVVAVLVLMLFEGIASLYRLRVARGDIFPEYSSLRADPLGVRALHDAAGLLPGCEGVRWLRPAERLQAGTGDVVFVAGLKRKWGRGLDDDGWAALDRAVVAGARVVVAWRAEAAEPGDGTRTREMRADPWATPVEAQTDAAAKDSSEKAAESARTEKPEKPDDPKKDRENPRGMDDPPPPYATEHERRWGFRLGRRELLQQSARAAAIRGADAPDAWPVTLPKWHSDLFFLPRDGDGWRVLYRRGAEAVMIERKRGAGSVVLMADSFVLSNEAVQRERATPLLAGLIGDARRVVFVESHLGLESEPGIAALARRYGLGGAALTALVLAGLWIWRRATPLAPILPEDEEVRRTLAPTAGLEALLRRAVAPAKLFSACMDAWRPNAASSDQRRLETAPPPGDESDPVAAYNAAARTLSRKRPT